MSQSRARKENDPSAQGPVRIILRILCVDHTDAEAEDADDNDGTADSDGADDAGGVHCSDGADDADGGRNLGWPETSAHYPLIGGRALQLAGVYDADDADADADFDHADAAVDADKSHNVSTHSTLIGGRSLQLAREEPQLS